MKFHHNLTILIAIAFGILGTFAQCRAQAFTPNLNYSVQYDPDCYTPLSEGSVIPTSDKSIQFLNFSGSVDMDDGTADSIPVGFTFEYNGTSSNTINVNVNGWVSVNPLGKINPIPLSSANGSALFSSVVPNNTLAPYWGDHYYRTLEPGYKPSRISILTSYVSPNVFDPPIGTFVLEWRDLNINDKTNPNSVASFQLIIRQNPMAWDHTAPDQRATIEFRYGPADTSAIVSGVAVGIEDSLGFTHLNGLFETSQFNGDSTRLSTARTTCWPPPNCTPCIAIEFVPVAQSASVANALTTKNFSLNAYPNPFTQAATISFLSPESGPAQVTIVNLLGAEVARLYDGELAPGEHSFTWDARGGEAGMYECVVRINGQVERIPIQLLR